MRPTFWFILRIRIIYKIQAFIVIWHLVIGLSVMVFAGHCFAVRAPTTAAVYRPLPHEGKLLQVGRLPARVHPLPQHVAEVRHHFSLSNYCMFLFTQSNNIIDHVTTIAFMVIKFKISVRVNCWVGVKTNFLKISLLLKLPKI